MAGSGDATIVELFEVAAAREAARPALRSKRAGAWVATTWGAWRAEVRALAAELITRGLAAGDRVAIFGNTREEWVTALLAVQHARGVVVPIYPTLIGEQAAYILSDSEARVLIAEDAAHVTRVHEAAPAVIEKLVAIVTFDEAGLAALPTALRLKTMSWRSLSLRAATRGGAEDDRVAARAAQGKPGDVATILYTSGTTGAPKGVPLTQAQFAFETDVLMRALGVGAEDEQLLLLPLAHVFAMMLAVGMVRAGGTIAFAQSLQTAVDDAGEVSPTFLGCVPRLYEKIHAVVTEKAKERGPSSARTFAWASAIGREAARVEERGDRVSWWLGAQRAIADRLVLGKVRARFGTRLRFVISGGAPLSRDLAEWFWGCGIKVLEGYGLTETTAGTNVNTLDAYRFGTVGRALEGVEVTIAPDGEVLARGPNVTRGYWKRDADTREAIDAEGWFHTGDVGAIDADGFLAITDRKKDLIVTAGGKNVAPQNIEALLRQSPWIQQAMVWGDRRPYLVALIALDAEATKGLSESEARERVQTDVDAVNARLSQFERIKRFAILPRELSIEGGELTPTLKIKRAVMGERYADRIAKLYE